MKWGLRDELRLLPMYLVILLVHLVMRCLPRSARKHESDDPGPDVPDDATPDWV